MIEPKKPFVEPSLTATEIQKFDGYTASGIERSGWDTNDYSFSFTVPNINE